MYGLPVARCYRAVRVELRASAQGGRLGGGMEMMIRLQTQSYLESAEFRKLWLRIDGCHVVECSVI